MTSPVDVSGIITESLKTTPIALILSVIVWRLWNKLAEKEAEQKAMIEKHEQARADQQRIIIELHERSITATTSLSTAIDKLRESVCDQQDTTNDELRKINTRLDRQNRPAPRSKPVSAQA